MLLFLDTSDNDKIRIALADKTSVKNFEYESGQRVSEHFLKQIKKFLQKHKVGLNDLTKLGVVVGPGHFSRIRTAVATVNALAYALQIPIVGVLKHEGHLKGDLHGYFPKMLKQKGTKQVKPVYGKAPNITKAKPKLGGKR